MSLSQNARGEEQQHQKLDKILILTATIFLRLPDTLLRETYSHQRNITVRQNPNQFLRKVIGPRNRTFTITLIIRGPALLNVFRNRS